MALTPDNKTQIADNNNRRVCVLRKYNNNKHLFVKHFSYVECNSKCFTSINSNNTITQCKYKDI